MDLIIGAGISGLGYAAATRNPYLIVERDKEIGGYCKTIYKDDYVWDYSGHFFHFLRPALRDYVMARIDPSEVLEVQKRTQIFYKGRHIDFPFQMNIHQLEQEEFIDCLYDLFTAPSSDDVTSFKQMLYAKFGRGIAERFLIPYNSKLYATDLDKLDVDAMGRFFPYADKEQIVRNFRNCDSHSYNASFLYPRKGCIRIIESVASHVDSGCISLDERLVGVDLQRHLAVTNRREIAYDRLISTLPFPTLLSLCRLDHDPSVYSCNKVLVFNLGFDSKGPERVNNWIYYPDPDLVFYRVGFYDNILGQGKMSLYVEIGFAHDAEIPDTQQLLQRTLDDLRRVGVVTNQQLVAHHEVLMDPAYVHITRQSEVDKAEKMETLARHDVYSIGRYGAWKYCSLEDNLDDAFQLAARLADMKS